jgi:AcrR family transcriptional regulator
MVGSRRRPVRKQAKRYHHGDLRRALLQEAARTIQAQGVERLTLRAVAERLGVSRTALYRHFADKSALLAGVAAEGFRTLATVTLSAWQAAGKGLAGLEAMGLAYVDFALTHPSHYRVMFGGFVDSGAKDPAFVQDAASAFDVLVDALRELQKDGLIRADEPELLARFVWATVHGVAMLGIDGQLQHQHADAMDLARLAVDRVRASLTSFDDRRSHPTAGDSRPTSKELTR